MACGCITDGLVDFESEDEDDEESQTQFSKGNTAGGTTHASGESSSGTRTKNSKVSSMESSGGGSKSNNKNLPKNVINESAGTGDEGVLNTPYDKVTPLFQNIEKENWQGVLMFLNTGKWGNSFFRSSAEHMKSPSPHIQARTWVTAYDKKTGEPEWSQLPLHAAISYMAPFVVVQKLVEIFPKAVQCTDREGMLPIHLAFGFGAPETVLALLLEAFPASVDEKGLGGRLPYECCELGPNKTRGKVYRVIADQTALKVQEEIDNEWKVFAKAAMHRLNLGISPTGEPMLLENNLDTENEEVDLSNKTLTEFLLELMEDRKELLDLKQKLQERLAKATATTTPAVAGGGRKKKSNTIKKLAPVSSIDNMVGAPMQVVELAPPALLLSQHLPIATVTTKSRSPIRSTKNRHHSRTRTPSKETTTEPTSSYENPPSSKPHRRSKSPAIFLALSRENGKEKRKSSNKDRKSGQ